MRIATWNVNSIGARLPRLLDWLERTAPDVAALQETKCADTAFPYEELERLGYSAMHVGDGRWNGVAIVAKSGLTPLSSALPGFTEARYANALAHPVGGGRPLQVISVYVPNGRTIDDAQYPYKLDWLAALRRTLDDTDPGDPVVLMGDFNVALSDEDVWDIRSFRGSTHVTEPERAGVRALLDWGLTDVRARPGKNDRPFTYWDYRAGMFPKDMGMRIDYVLASRPVTILDAYVDRETRKGKQPSDHAPIVVDIELQEFNREHDQRNLQRARPELKLRRVSTMTDSRPPRAQIPESMQAVVCHGPGDYELEEVAVPRPGPGEVLVKVEAVGICASDLKCYHGAAKFWGDENRPAYAETEVIPGHEFVGTVIELDEAAAGHWNIAVDDRVVSEQIVPCWKCRYCRDGHYWMCAPHDIYGFKRRTPGAMAEYMIYSRDALVHKVSADLPPAHAAFAEPLSCALHAVERADITFNDVVVVAGCGPIGLGMVAGSRAKNPRLVVALDLARDKLAVAKACGADVTIDIASEDAVARVRDLTNGDGADVYLEGTGHPAAVKQGLNLLRKLGTYVEYSVFGSDVTVDWSIISDDKELDVRGAHLGPHCWPAAIRLIESGRLPMDQICTHQLPLAAFQQGLDLVSSGQESIKVTLIP